MYAVTVTPNMMICYCSVNHCHHILFQFMHSKSMYTLSPAYIHLWRIPNLKGIKLICTIVKHRIEPACYNLACSSCVVHLIEVSTNYRLHYLEFPVQLVQNCTCFNFTLCTLVWGGYSPLSPCSTDLGVKCS